MTEPIDIKDAPVFQDIANTVRVIGELVRALTDKYPGDPAAEEVLHQFMPVLTKIGSAFLKLREEGLLTYQTPKEVREAANA